MTTEGERMKRKILIATAFLFSLFLIATAYAFTITSSDSFTASHNSVLPINITVDNTGENGLQNMTIAATNILNASDILTATVSNISANEKKNYTLNYNIVQYTYAKAYSTDINISGQDITGNMFSATKTVSITVNESKSISASATSLSRSVSAGGTSQAQFTITNTGNVNLTNIVVTQQSTLNDSKGNTITLSITSDKNLASLKPGEGATIYIGASVPKGQERDTYSTVLSINSSEGVSTSLTYNIDVRLGYCELGKMGSYFAIEIKEPDDGDDFYPNDEILVSVRVRNYDDDEQDVTIKADLYDETDDDFLDVDYEDDVTIDDDSSEDYEFTIEIPLDVENTHDYKVYAKVYEEGNEDEQCAEDYVTIDIKKESHAIMIDKVEVPETIECDREAEFKVKMANTGKNDEDIKVQIVNTALEIDESKTADLDSGESRTLTVPVKIPKSAGENTYTFNIRVYFQLSNDEYKKDIYTTKQVKVKGNCIAPTEEAVMSAEALSDAMTNEKFGIKVTLFNLGESANTFNIIASDYESWARLESIEPATLTIEGGKSDFSYIYLVPLETVTGSQRITIKALFGSKRIEKTLTINVKEKISAPTAYKRLAERLSNMSGFDIATVNIVLVVAIILTFMWIIRVRRAY